MNLRPAFLLLTWLVASTYLDGIELFLKNGDRLQGELIVESDHHVTLLHPILGEIEIAKSALAEPPAPEKRVPAPAPTKPTAPSGRGGKEQPAIEEEEPSKEETEEAEDHDSLVYLLPNFLWNSPKELIHALQKMNSKIGFSFSDKSSRRDQTDIRFFYNSKWKNGKSEYRFDTDYRYRETDGDTSENRYTGEFRFRRQQHRDFFIQATTFYKRDPIRKVDNWLQQGLGGGWKKKVSPDFEYSLGAEGSLKYEEFNNGDSGLSGYEVVTALFEDSVYQIGKSYQLVQEAEFYITPDDSNNWGYRFEVKLDGKISKGFSVRVGYQYNFDNIQPTKVPQKETLFSTSLLYTF